MAQVVEITPMENHDQFIPHKWYPDYRLPGDIRSQGDDLSGLGTWRRLCDII